MPRKRQPIEPKPTTYQGQRFRSRLEARWAVFLDYIPNVISWQYEPKTFTLPSGWDYTPDFLTKLYRPSSNGEQLRMYLECKPALINLDYHKFLLRVSEYSDAAILLIMCNMYDDTKIASTLYAQGQAYPSSIDEFFSNNDKAIHFAYHHRFDLKE